MNRRLFSRDTGERDIIIQFIIVEENVSLGNAEFIFETDAISYCRGSKNDSDTDKYRSRYSYVYIKRNIIFRSKKFAKHSKPIAILVTGREDRKTLERKLLGTQARILERVHKQKGTKLRTLETLGRQ